MRSIVVGLGETGLPLYQILREAYGDSVAGLDTDPERQALADAKPIKGQYEVLNICIGWSDRFFEIVNQQQEQWEPQFTIIHSTVPVGTTGRFKRAVHSPILGTHTRMKQDLRTYTKWIGGKQAHDAERYLSGAGLRTYVMPSSDHTEYLKLRCLVAYGNAIAFAAYDAENRSKLGIKDDEVYNWDANYNDHVLPSLKRPVITPPHDGKIGGHCVVPGARLLNKDYPSHLLDEIMRRGHEPDGSKFWQPSNVYPSAKIGKNVSIGAFCEIGANVVIRDNVRIGAMSFIPEGVTIEDGAWIGPRVTFTNDMYPPSGRDSWLKTVVCEGARIGASVTILPGVYIGEKSFVGAGSVVTKSVPAEETWAGVPARKIEHKEAVGA